MYWNVGRVMLYNKIVCSVQSSFLYLLTYVVDSFFFSVRLFFAWFLSRSVLQCFPFTQCNAAKQNIVLFY